MAKSLILTHKSLLFRRPTANIFQLNPIRLLPVFYSTTKTPFPLQYDMIINHPTQSSLSTRTRIRKPTTPENFPESEPPEKPDVELGFDDWVDRKLSSERKIDQPRSESAESGMDKSKRKYYNKRTRRMYGTDSEDEERRNSRNEGFVELQPEVVEFNRLHKREEELYFHDAFAYPWEKDKHYKMVYQLEKKYFPDHSLDKAFLQPGQTNADGREKMGKVKKEAESGKDEKGMVFFDDESKESKEEAKIDLVGKKVEEFFKCLKKVPTEKKNNEVIRNGEEGPYVLTRTTQLPPKWDGPNGTMVLINKPKGWTSFTVCGKLRRLVGVKKVGHAGTLDPMATGLLIVCVGKATKVVDSYQGMIKGYSGTFRLGEATRTLDADSPVEFREPWEHIKDEDIKKAAASFLGEIWQVPPMFSAIKVGGEKMYDKARRGEHVELAPRRISIFQFDIERSLEDRQNLIFRVTCSKGTYIRSLCADLAKALGSCAHLTALRRDSIGQYSADDAWEFKDLEEAVPKGYL